jgi:Fur family zinc uptake transcriptional regulator
MADTSFKLTKNQALVLGALNAAKAPKSAYELLDDLREEGLRAPLQIYRALEKLTEAGHAHRLESLNAFVACSHACCETERTVAFMICRDCESVEEIRDEALSRDVIRLSANSGLTNCSAVVELRGTCADCAV